MCRIYGYLGGGPVPPSRLEAVAGAQLSGGPDAQTVHLQSDWALGNNRLAVQGIGAGAGVQPFRLGRLSCVFNGEIYNHRELRAELAAAGYSFAGDCDGDVLLPLYERHGADFVHRLQGMFAIALIDERAEPELRLFTDHAGMKSLFYFLDRDRFCFASELPALRNFPGFPDELDPLSIDRYLGGKAVWGPGTVYRKVRSTVPGSAISFRPDTGVLERTWVLEAGEFDPDFDLDVRLSYELRRMLTPDVPVCVITSGGLDSSYLTAIASGLVPDLASFNVAYEGDWPSDERHFAAEVAQRYGTVHHQVLLRPADFPSLTERFVQHLDQPNNAPHSLSTFGLFEAIHQAGYKVALTGDGADELYAGYARYSKAAEDGSQDWHRSYQSTMAVAGASALLRLYNEEFRAAVLSAGGPFVDRSGDELAARVAAGTHGKLEELLRYDQYQRFPYYILRRVDHLSMAHAVEARIPFLQPAIVRHAHQLPASAKVISATVKAPVVAAARARLPASVLNRPKQPFTLPITQMIRPGEALYDLIGDVLLAPGCHTSDYVDRGVVTELFELQTETRAQHAAEILWSLLVLDLWLSAHTAATPSR